MSASNPQGEMQFWDNGFPFAGVQNGVNNTGEMQFWDNGFPNRYILPANAYSLIKTFNGLLNASTKTDNGLTNALLKTKNGLSNI